MNNFQDIKSINFSSVSDQVNWVYGSGSLVNTVSGKLELFSANSTNVFKRLLGSAGTSNNKIGIKINLEVELSVNQSITETKIKLSLAKTNGEIIGSSNIQFSNIAAGYLDSYLFEREFDYDQNLGNVELLISVPEGHENIIRLLDLQAYSYTFSQSQIRSYFVLSDFFETSIPALNKNFTTQGGIELKQWKVDNVETLTNIYFGENNLIVGGPTVDWNYAKSELSGNNRSNEEINPISFNPFIREFGLTFDNSNYYSGKPTQTTSGNNYGSGILEIGIDKPIILNGNLQEKKAPFFIDIDYTKNLRIKFDIIVNRFFLNIFENPLIYREYTIEWDAATCTKRFFYIDKIKETGKEVDELINGFLSGLTPIRKTEIIRSGQFAEITWNNTFSTEDREGVAENQEIFFGGTLFPVSQITWQKSTSGNNWSNLGTPVNSINLFTLANGGNQFRLRAVSNGAMVFSNVLIYLKQTKPKVSGISFLSNDKDSLNVCVSIPRNGGAEITECGIVFNETGNPTVSDNKVLYSNIIGSQCQDITRPTPSTLYYFSVFATNSVGTTYLPYPNKI